MEELEKASKKYRDFRESCGYNDPVALNEIEAAFFAGAEWQKEQFEKERLKHCDELTAEQAQIESDFVVQHLKNFNRTPTFIDAIEYGRKMAFDKAIEWIKLYILNHDDIDIFEMETAFKNELMEE